MVVGQESSHLLVINTPKYHLTFPIVVTVQHRQQLARWCDMV